MAVPRPIRPALRAERDLYPQVLSLPEFVGKDIDFQEEFPFCGKFVDLVGQSPGSDEIVAVEVKLDDWRRVVRQARQCQVFADKVYVALWHTRGTRADREWLQAMGLGLILVDHGEARIELEATTSTVLSTHAREMALKALCSSVSVVD